MSFSASEYNGSILHLASACNVVRNVHAQERKELAVTQELAESDITDCTRAFVDSVDLMMRDGHGRIVYHNHAPIGVLGSVVLSNADDTSCVWALIDDRHTAKEIMQATRFGFDMLAQMVSTSWGINYVHAHNTRSRRWLERLGAQFEQEPFIINGEPFHMFSLRF